MTRQELPNPTHKRVEDDLKAYVDGELSLLRRAQIARHLRTCAACRRKEEAMRKLTEQVQTLGVASDASAPLPAPLRAKLLATIPTGRAGDGPHALPLWRQKPGLVFGGGGAALAASFAAFAVLYGPMSNVTQDSSATATTEAVAEATGAAPAAAVSGAIAAPTSTATAVSQDANGVPGDAAAVRGQIASAGAKTAEAQQMVDRLSTAPAGAPVEQNKSNRVFYARGVVAQAATRAASARIEQQSELTDERQVHREATLGVAVSNVEAASVNVERLVKETGGYVASNVLSTDDSGYKRAELTLKVPETSFEETLTAVSRLGDVRSKNIMGEDITDKVSDATSDEQVLMDDTKALEERLKGGGLSDRRTAQKEAELRQVRQQLARTRARLGLLRRQAHLSTLSVFLSEQAKAATETTPKSGFWYDLKDSNRSALKAFQAAVRVPLLLVIWAVALSPVWLPLLLVYRHLSRKQALAQAAAQASAPAATPPADLNR